MTTHHSMRQPLVSAGVVDVRRSIRYLPAGAGNGPVATTAACAISLVSAGVTAPDVDHYLRSDPGYGPVTHHRGLRHLAVSAGVSGA